MKVSKGEYGYIKAQTKSHLRLSIMGVFLIISIYVLGNVMSIEKNIYLLLSALCALPVAKYLVKFILYVRYKEGNQSIYNKLKTYENEFVVLSSLIIVRQKNTIFYPFIIIGEKEIIIYTNENNKVKSIELIEELLTSKGYANGIKIFTNDNEMFNYIDKINIINQVKSQQKEIANVLLANGV